jgi:ERF superfamily
MSTAIQITDKRSSAIEQAHAMSPMQELQMRIIREGDIDKLAKLMDLEERWRKASALTAYNEAMAQFKAAPPTIRKNKHVAFDSKSGGARTDYWHATLDNVCECIVPALAAVGLRHSWDVKEASAQITVTCTVTHSMGHSESVSLSGPLDATGNKNVIQQKGSTVTYLERYTLLAITGLAAADQDDDARKVVTKPEEPREAMEGAAVADFISSIEGAGDVDELQRNYFAARDAATKASDKKALNEFAEAKNARYLKLAPRRTK